jgi:hypothetical protein
MFFFYGTGYLIMRIRHFESASEGIYANLVSVNMMPQTESAEFLLKTGIKLQGRN